MSAGFRTWIKFNTVGAIGIGVQLGALALLKDVLGFHYLAATVIAVETAIIHNLIWHERWTWSERTRTTPEDLAVRFIRFHFTNGLISLSGNAALMWILVSRFHLTYFAANVLAIGACSFANFRASDRFVFQ